MRPRPEDLELVDLRFGDSRTTATLLLDGHLCRPDGKLYGGAGIAASVIAMEAATGRDAIWVTTQFVSAALSGVTLDCVAEVLATGRRTSQVRVTASAGGRVAFTALGSTGVRAQDALTGQFETMPAVEPPGNAQVRQGWGHLANSYSQRIEMREAVLLGPEMHRGPHQALWARVTGRERLTPAGISFLADMVPVAIARAAGYPGAGTSLDNSMRFGPDAQSEWVLLELRGHLSTGGYGHGTVYCWTPDGTLVAVGGQTANIFQMPRPG